MKTRFLYLLFVSLFLMSCGQQGSKKELERLKAENDSLQAHKFQVEEELNDYFATLNIVQENIEKIKKAQSVIPIHPLSENTPDDIKKRVKTDITYISELIQNNKDELDKLKQRLKLSSINVDKLNETIEALTKQLDEETIKVAKLQTQLAQKDSVIADLGTTVVEMEKDIDELSEMNKQSEEIILIQDEVLNTAWYAIGSKKELKDNNIVTSEGLFSSKKILQSDFNKNYFVKVDTRDTKLIPLYTNSKPKVLTNHPAGSYNLSKEDGGYVVNITDSDQFWNVSKYLVVETN